jgi:hypothetical protein
LFCFVLFCFVLFCFAMLHSPSFDDPFSCRYVLRVVLPHASVSCLFQLFVNECVCFVLQRRSIVLSTIYSAAGTCFISHEGFCSVFVLSHPTFNYCIRLACSTIA